MGGGPSKWLQDYIGGVWPNDYDVLRFWREYTRDSIFVDVTKNLNFFFNHGKFVKIIFWGDVSK